MAGSLVAHDHGRWADGDAMVRRTLAFVVFAFTMLVASCGSSSDVAERPAITVARIESTLISDAPEGLASTSGDTTTSPDGGDGGATIDVGGGEDFGTVADDAARPNTSLDIEFVSFELDDAFDEGHVIDAWVPTGWEASEFFGRTYEPSNLGFFTELSLDTGCNGVCEPRDWATDLTGENGPIGSDRQNNEVLRDEAIDDGWLIVSQGTITLQVRLYRWNNDADFFFVCRANLDDDDANLVDDMISICAAARPQWLG